MLLNFTCSNFRSFRTEQTLSMLPGSMKNHQGHIISQNDVKLLSVSAIFGANASGKSNIYKAMRYSRDFILGNKIDNQSYFRLDPTCKEEPSSFEYEFSIGDKIYRYGFQTIISKGSIVGEWLWRVSSNESQEDSLIFQRPLDSNPCPKLISKYKIRISRHLILTLADELRKKADPEIQEIVNVRNWFENNLKIIGTDENLLCELDYTTEQCQELSRFLGDFDVGISSVGFELVDKNRIESEQTRRVVDKLYIADHIVKKDISTLPRKDYRKADARDQTLVLTNNHGSKEELFLWYDESDGTRRLMDLASIVISSVPDITYIVDELDRSLHPMVVYELVRRFSSKRAIEPPKQLIFTTHQTCLLDQDLLRRDEIWFVQKERDGQSNIYSLDEYDVRFDKNIEKMYLGGRYDAIPKITRGD